MNQETLDQLQDIWAYLVEDMHACMLDVHRGEPGAEQDFYEAGRRLQSFGEGVAALSHFNNAKVLPNP